MRSFLDPTPVRGERMTSRTVVRTCIGCRSRADQQEL
ncbi:YlxR family protein, partial [Xanthomonas citri pv. citri]|nr:YlxR family protein [Xanthomonas citri pv. citri]